MISFFGVRRGFSQDHQIVGRTGLVDVDGPSPRSCPFEWAGAEKGVQFLVVDEDATRWTLSLLSFGSLLLHFDLQGLSRV